MREMKSYFYAYLPIGTLQLHQQTQRYQVKSNPQITID
jgi:hypothetical protein